MHWEYIQCRRTPHNHSLNGHQDPPEEKFEDHSKCFTETQLN